MQLLQMIDRWLPPPEILRLSGLGVDISESSIKYIGFSPSYTGLFALSMDSYGEVDIGPDILSQGEIKDVDKLSKVLSEVKKRTGVPYMRLSLPEERVYLFETEIEQGLSQKEIRAQLEFRLEENVPLSPRDSYFDFHISQPLSKGGQCPVAVTVCAKEVIDSYYEACRKAGITPLSFEVESQAIARAVLSKGDRGTRLLIDFGKTRTGLGIVHDGILLYTSTIDIGGNDLSVSLRRQLGEKPEADLTTLKNNFGLVKGADKANYIEALLPVISSVKDEIQTRLNYWNEKNGATRPIGEIILCGASANLRGLATYFTETLGVETTLADVWQNAFDPKLLAPPIDRRHSYSYATAVGLALASFSTNL